MEDLVTLTRKKKEEEEEKGEKVQLAKSVSTPTSTSSSIQADSHRSTGVQGRPRKVSIPAEAREDDGGSHSD